MKPLLKLALAGACVFVLVKWRRVWAGKAWHDLPPMQNGDGRYSQRVPF